MYFLAYIRMARVYPFDERPPSLAISIMPTLKPRLSFKEDLKAIPSVKKDWSVKLKFNRNSIFSAFQSWIPITAWLPKSTRFDLKHDVITGITLAFVCFVHLSITRLPCHSLSRMLL